MDEGLRRVLTALDEMARRQVEMRAGLLAHRRLLAHLLGGSADGLGIVDVEHDFADRLDTSDIMLAHLYRQEIDAVGAAATYVATRLRRR